METLDENGSLPHQKETNKMSEEPIFKVPELNLPKKSNKTSEQPQKDNEKKDFVSSKTNSSMSPAEKLKDLQTPIPYKEPSWGGISDDKYCLEVLKNGVIVDNINLIKSFYVFGRLQSCDITMEHPSLSRHHAVIQFCAINNEKQSKGWYVYDLDSTHGTWINKNKVYAKKYYRIHVGHVLKFGGSTRLYILQGPEDDQEEESELSVTEMKEQREKQKKEAEVLRQADIAVQEKKLQAIRKKEEDTGCSWGMAEDAFDEENANGFLDEIKLENEELYIADPKKALKGFYEREGYEEPEYIVTDAGTGKYKCAVELPVDGPNGEPVIAEAVVSGKKKEAVLQCALEGCRILDRMNLLRAATHESRKRKQKNWEEDDFYDSDEDSFLDRTGDIEKKRQQRMKKAGKLEGKTETYTSLVEKHEVIMKDIQEIEAKLEKAKADAAAMENDDIDALDAYMMAIKSGVMDTKTKMALKRQLMELKQEEAKIRKLVNIAKPASMPELKSPQIVPKPATQLPQTKLPVVGKIRSQKAQKRPFVVSRPVKEIKEMEDFVEEEEEEDENQEVLEKLSREDPTSRLKVEPSQDTSSEKHKSSHNSEKNESPAKVNSHSPAEVTKTRLKDTIEDKPKSKIKEIEKHKKKDSQKNVNTEGKITGDYDSTDPDYAVWLPPSGQSGDGKTSLNEKYGY